MTEKKLELGDLLETAPKGEPWGGYDFNKPSLAVIADGGTPHRSGCVLWTVGAHVRMEMEEGGLSALDDLGLEAPDVGIWIWEGKYSWDSDGYSEPRGKFRRPTEEEWQAIREGRCPWNDEDWKLKKHEEHP